MMVVKKHRIYISCAAFMCILAAISAISSAQVMPVPSPVPRTPTPAPPLPAPIPESPAPVPPPPLPVPPSPIPQERVPVEEVLFVGNTAVPTDELRVAAGVQAGQTVTPTVIQEAVNKIREAYTNRGYIADVTEVEIRGTQPPRSLVFHILEARISEIEITGLVRTNESVIRRYLRVRPGDLFSIRAIQQDIRDLNRLAIFEQVEAVPEEGDEPGQVVLVWNLRETKTGEISVGGSYSPEGSLIAQVQYSQRNLHGRAQRLSVIGFIGSIEGAVGGNITYFNPIIGTPRISLLGRGYSDVTFRFQNTLSGAMDRYFERHTGVQGVVTRPTGNGRSMAYGLRVENAVTHNFPPELIASAGISPNASIIMPSAQFVNDGRLYILLPASGTYFGALLEPGIARPRTGGTTGIGRLSVDQRWYIPLQRITPEMADVDDQRATRTLAIRLAAGTSAGDLPFFEQFFVGGIETLRGYLESRFWGKHYFLLNTEYRFPLGRQFVGVAFADVGDAWDSPYQYPVGAVTDYAQHTSFSPRVGVGAGVWYLLPFGFARLEYASGEANRVTFAIGEHF